MSTNLKTIEEFTKEELFKFYEEIRSSEPYIQVSYAQYEPNEYLLDNIETMIKEMESRK